MKLDIKKLLLYIFITLVIGVFPSIFVFKDMNIYDTLNKPFLSPNKFVFPFA